MEIPKGYLEVTRGVCCKGDKILNRLALEEDRVEWLDSDVADYGCLHIDFSILIRPVKI